MREENRLCRSWLTSCSLKRQHYTVTLFGQRPSERILSGFHPELGSFSSTLCFLIISGSHDWGVEEGVTEEALYMGVDPEGEEVGSQLETEVQRLSSCKKGAGLCLEVVCTWEGWWRTGEEWTVEGGAWKLAKGANGRCGCPLTDDAGNCGAKCRQAWRDCCRLDSEEQGRICFG